MFKPAASRRVSGHMHLVMLEQTKICFFMLHMHAKGSELTLLYLQLRRYANQDVLFCCIFFSNKNIFVVDSFVLFRQSFCNYASVYYAVSTVR